MKNRQIKLISSIIIFVSIIINLAFTASIGLANSNLSNPLQAATPTPIPEVSTYKNSASFTFLDLGQDKIVLNYPDSAGFGINLPDYWNFNNGDSVLEFHYDLEVNQGATSPSQGSITGDGKGTPPVEIKINNVIVGSFFPTIGKNQYARFTLSQDVLATLTDPVTNPSKQLSIIIGFFHSLDLYCGSDAILTIYNDSKFDLNFKVEAPNRDLSLLPGMIAQGSFIPETILVVIPDSFTDNDLAVASNMGAFVGSAGLNNVIYKVVKASQVTQDDMAAYSAILVGQPTQNGLISQLYLNGILPTTISPEGLIKRGETLSAKEDGVIQIIPSPNNPLNTFLIVTGNSDEGVLLASNELKRTTRGLSSNVYIFKPSEMADIAPMQQGQNEFQVTFRQSLFSTQVFRGPGSSNTFVSFYIPRDWEIQPGAKIIVNYNYSSSLSMSYSALTVSLNGTALGSVPFDKNIQGDRSAEVELNPANLYRGNINTLMFTANRRPEMECADFDPTIYWITLRDNSVIKIPYKKITDAKYLAPFSNPFNYLANEGNLLISVPQSPTNEDLSNVVTFASRLGEVVRSQNLLNIAVTRQDGIDQNMYKDYNLLIYGKPSQNAVLVKANNDLIQQFVEGQDVLKQQKANVEIHTPQDVDLGVIQVVPNKNNLFRGMTTLSGTTNQGVKYAMDNAVGFYGFNGADLFYVGANNNLIGFLSTITTGNIADIVASVSGNPNEALTVVPVTTQSASSQFPASQSNQSGFSIGILFAIIVIGVVIIALGIFQVMRGRISKK